MTLELTLTLVLALLFSAGRAHAQAGTFLDPGVGPQPTTGFRVSLVNATITPSFTYSPTGGAWPLAVQFVDTTQGGPGSWSWDFGDGSASTTQNPLHTFNSASNFVVSLSVTGPGGSGSTNHIVAVTNAVGRVLWLDPVLTTRGSKTCQMSAIAADLSGNVYAGGTFNDTISINGTTNTYNSLNTSALLVKYNSNSNLVWFRTWGLTGNAGVGRIAVDSQTNIIVVGNFSDTVNFGGTSLTAPDPLLQHAQDMYIAKYTAASNLVWVVQFGGTKNDQGFCVGLDSSDNIFVGGIIFSATATIGSITVTNLGVEGMGLAKLNSSGVAQWAKCYGTATIDQPNGMAIDPNGDVYVTGQFSGNTDLGTGTLTASGSPTIFFCKYSGANGSAIWTKAAGGTGFNAGQGITIDPGLAKLHPQ